MTFRPIETVKVFGDKSRDARVIDLSDVRSVEKDMTAGLYKTNGPDHSGVVFGGRNVVVIYGRGVHPARHRASGYYQPNTAKRSPDPGFVHAYGGGRIDMYNNLARSHTAAFTTIDLDGDEPSWPMYAADADTPISGDLGQVRTVQLEGAHPAVVSSREIDGEAVTAGLLRILFTLVSSAVLLMLGLWMFQWSSVGYVVALLPLLMGVGLAASSIAFFLDLASSMSTRGKLVVISTRSE